MLQVDAIVVNYRTPGDLSDFLGSFETSSFDGISPRLTICNVDPQPRDLHIVLEFERVTNLQVPIRHIVFDENVGYARAVNHAASLGDGDVLVAFNADIVLSRTALTTCSVALMSRDEWGVLGPLQVDASLRGVHTGIFGPMAAPTFRSWRRRVPSSERDVRDDVVNVAGSAYFVKRKVWDELAGCPVFREQFPDAEGAFLETPHFYEETGCSYHAIAHGYRCVYYGGEQIVHKWHQASPVGGWAERQIPVSREIFRRFCDAHGIEHE